MKSGRQIRDNYKIMPVNVNTDYKSPFYLFSKDIQTILPALFRKVEGVSYKRERIFTPDDDFLDLDWSYSEKASNRLVIISHGLEGDSKRPYVLGMAKALNLEGFDILAWNYRGCSGELNKQYRFYHSGETSDLEFVINYAQNKGYTNINLVGFSIGGNITLKFLGEKNALAYEIINKAVAISTPCHLESVAWHLAKFRSKVYMSRFLKSLSQKMKAKAEVMPDLISCENLSGIKNFFEFDNLYTAPMNGYKDAVEYWTKNSSLYYLPHINTPTLILSADNDPFLTPECYPYKEASDSNKLFLEVTSGGGHCGFYTSDKDGIYWSERRVASFLKDSNN